MVSALATSSRLSVARPAKLPSSANSSVSQDCKLEVNAAARSQIFRDPISRNVRSWERRPLVVQVFVARQPAVCRLPQRTGQR